MRRFRASRSPCSTHAATSARSSSARSVRGNDPLPGPKRREKIAPDSSSKNAELSIIHSPHFQTVLFYSPRPDKMRGLLFRMGGDSIESRKRTNGGAPCLHPKP